MNSLVTSLYQRTPTSSQPPSKPASATASPARHTLQDDDDDLFIVDRDGEGSGKQTKEASTKTATEANGGKRNEVNGFKTTGGNKPIVSIVHVLCLRLLVVLNLHVYYCYFHKFYYICIFVKLKYISVMNYEKRSFSCVC